MANIRFRPREHEVLALVAQGLVNREIGEALGIAPSTVNTHIVHMMRVLRVHDRLTLVARARERGLLAEETAP